MNEVRIFCLNLMRTRELPLWKRIAMLGTFCAALSGLCGGGRQAAIPSLIDDFVRLIEDGDLQASLDGIEANHPAQAMVFATLWAAKGFDASSPYQQAQIRQISARLGANEYGQTDGATLVATYLRGLARLDDALAEAPYLLENYLVNELLLRMFPFETLDAYDSYLRIVSRFCLLRLLLAAQCSTDEPMSPVALVATVQLHCRRFQHDNAYTDRINLALQESGWASLERLHGLVRT
jgi:lysine-N-methylase